MDILEIVKDLGTGLLVFGGFATAVLGVVAVMTTWPGLSAIVLSLSGSWFIGYLIRRGT